jgi:hypothetical protein
MAPPPETPSPSYIWNAIGSITRALWNAPDQWSDGSGFAQVVHSRGLVFQSCSHAETRGAFGIRQYEENQALSIWNVAIATVLFWQITIDRNQEGTRIVEVIVCQFCATYGDVSHQLLTWSKICWFLPSSIFKASESRSLSKVI